MAWCLIKHRDNFTFTFRKEGRKERKKERKKENKEYRDRGCKNK
jgi:hypothetical protein